MFSLPVIIVALICDIVAAHQYEVRVMDTMIEAKTVCDLDPDFLLAQCKDILHSTVLSIVDVHLVEGHSVGAAKMYRNKNTGEVVSACKCPTKPGLYFLNTLFTNAADQIFSMLVEKSDTFKTTNDGSSVGQKLNNELHDQSDSDDSVIERGLANQSTGIDAQRGAEESSNTSRFVKLLPSKMERPASVDANALRRQVKPSANADPPNGKGNADISAIMLSEILKGSRGNLLENVLRESMQQPANSTESTTETDPSFESSESIPSLNTFLRNAKKSGTPKHPIVDGSVNVSLKAKTLRIGNNQNHHHHYYYDGNYDNENVPSGNNSVLDSTRNGEKSSRQGHHGMEQIDENNPIDGNLTDGYFHNTHKVDESQGETEDECRCKCPCGILDEPELPSESRTEIIIRRVGKKPCRCAPCEQDDKSK